MGSSRWERAQSAELGYWRRKRDAILECGYRGEIRGRARRVEKLLRPYWDGKCGAVLEVGGGGTQLVDHFEMSDQLRCALEPLAHFYKKEFESVLNPRVKWCRGRMEEAPFRDGTFGLTICSNVLDHVESPGEVLNEIVRVLHPSGVVYLALNTFSGPLHWFRTMFREEEHPHVLTHAGLKRLIARHAFRIEEEILDAPPMMRHFDDEVYTSRTRHALHNVLLMMRCYHFSEFILRKRA